MLRVVLIGSANAARDAGHARLRLLLGRWRLLREAWNCDGEKRERDTRGESQRRRGRRNHHDN